MGALNKSGRPGKTEAVPVVGVGAGGHCRVLMSILRSGSVFRVACLLDADRNLWGGVIDGVTVEGGDDMLAGLKQKGIEHAFNGVGSVKDTAARRRVFDLIGLHGLKCPDIIHPDAIVSENVESGRGVIIMAGSVLNNGAVLGCNVLINTRAVIEHDCRILDHAVVSPGAVVCGGCEIGEGTFVGAGAVIKEGIRIGKGCIVAAGAVVLRDVKDNKRVAGVPARDI